VSTPSPSGHGEAADLHRSGAVRTGARRRRQPGLRR
jgi:hypothetical protein